MPANSEEQCHKHIVKPQADAKQQKPLTVAKVLMKQMSKLNEKIVNYFKKNLLDLNASNFVFEWIAVYEEEMEYYEEQGLEKFPVLIVDNINITGVSNIFRYLNDIIESNRTVRKVKKSESIDIEVDEMHDFLLNELKSNDNDKETDEQEVFSNSIQHRVSAMHSARKAGGMEIKEDDDIFVKNSPAPKLNNSADQASLKTTDIAKRISKGSGEDDMMDKYWANQEETPMD